MASPEASSSRAAAQLSTQMDHAAALGASPDELAALGELLSRRLASSGATDLGDLGSKTLLAQAKRQRDIETRMLEQAPSYLKLHDDLQASQLMLGELSSFLDVFHTDLSALSTQMNALQSKSVRLKQRLQNRRALEGRMRDIVDSIVLSPQDIDLIFADETTARGAGLDAWRGCAERLSACLFACQELETLSRKQAGSNSSSTQNIDFKALKEAREVAEGCRTMAAAKLRPLLMSTFAPLKTSLSTNLPVWQSILLRQYRPLYRFLSQHVPRVAIDVQRAYISATRLYFETGFRRYERTLAKLRDKEKARGFDRTAFGDLPARSGLGPLFISTVSGSSTTAQADPWMPEAAQLDLGRIADGPAVILAYLADEPNYRASLESLYRSLSLTFLDNASSEFCFLARFFEAIDVDGSLQMGSRTGSTTDQSSGVKVRRADARSSLDGDDEDPLPEDSASARGDDTVDGAEEVDQGTVVRLSEIEQRRLQSRGAIGELWKQVMEPSLNTYTAFVKSIIELQPQLLPLYIMLRLNERMLDEVQTRGTASILQGPLMSFKLQAWPLLQKQFNDAIESVKMLHGGDGSKGSNAPAQGGSGGFFGGFGGVFGGSSSSASSTGAPSDDVLRLVCTRYAYLYSSIVQLNSTSGTAGSADDDDGNIDTSASNVFASLARLRTEIETLIRTSAARTPASAQICYSALRNTLETGPASLTLPAIQKELSHWTEAERASRK